MWANKLFHVEAAVSGIAVGAIKNARDTNVRLGLFCLVHRFGANDNQGNESKQSSPDKPGSAVIVSFVPFNNAASESENQRVNGKVNNGINSDIIPELLRHRYTPK